MPSPHISIIIPASSEVGHLEKLVSSLRAQSYTDFEIIVSVNGAKDETAHIARELVDYVIETPEPIGPAEARNVGARKARGDILLFIDADSVVSSNTLSDIARVWRPEIYGTILARPGMRSLRAHLYIGTLNLMRQTRLYSGAPPGVIFLGRELFEKIGGFNPKKRVGEYHDLIKRLRRNGAKFTLVDTASVQVSMRRQKKNGYFSTVFFWIRWRFASPTTKIALEETYWK